MLGSDKVNTCHISSLLTLIRQLNQRRQPTKNIEVLPISFAPTESSLFTTPLLLSHHSY
ncbi:MAG: hypothetical protein ACI95X_001281, partial [Paraglaciecola sp.]